jgi:hypothetical protein
VFKTILNPSQTVATGVGIGIVDLFIFNQHLPPMADIRTAQPHNGDVDTTRRQATGMCIVVNAFISLMTRDWDVFLIGGVVTVGMSYLAVHANALNPQTGKLDAGTPTLHAEAAVYSMPDYGYNAESAG